MIVGPTLQRGKIGLATSKPRSVIASIEVKGWRTPRLTGVGDLIKGIKQRSDGCGHP